MLTVAVVAVLCRGLFESATACGGASGTRACTRPAAPPVSRPAADQQQLAGHAWYEQAGLSDVYLAGRGLAHGA